ncbi:glutathione S-transferase D7-like [Ctenocephalides felis]|uniref:glutathione S-transferase D7-like n=1 Tax=Ctenocephalides felis TaxID=7515 RepID=UPI000E6E39D4|nr:glutathione S-transferase D7-like [Ctenocephalides felis]
MRWNLEAMLEDKEWVAGPTITIADIALVTTVSNIESCGTDVSIYPQLSAWYERTKAALEPYGYEEINQSGADQFGEWLKSKLDSQ